MNDRMKIFHDLCEEHGFLDLFERLNQKVYVIISHRGGEDEINYLLRGPEVDLELEYRDWITQKLRKSPSEIEPYEELLKQIMDLNSSYQIYEAKKRELNIEDFIISLRTKGFEQLTFELTYCY